MVFIQQTFLPPTLLSTAETGPCLHGVYREDVLQTHSTTSILSAYYIRYHAVLCLVAKSCLSPYGGPHPVDCNPPGSSVHGILQARIPEWIAIPFSRGSSPTQGQNLGLQHCRQIFYHLSHQGSPRILQWGACPFSRGSSSPRN